MNRTTSLTVNRDGSDLGRCFPDGWGGSHFDWRDGDNLMIGFNSTFTGQRQVYFLKLTFGR